MLYTSEVTGAMQAVESAALKSVHARWFPAEGPHADAASEHADEQLCLAARDLARAIEALPAKDRPIGWDEHSFGPFSTEAVAS